MQFKYGTCWEWCIHPEWDYFEDDGEPVDPKPVFDQMAAPDPEIMEGSLYSFHFIST
jgi:hypothetical protein